VFEEDKDRFAWTDLLEKVLRAELIGGEISELRSEDFNDISPLTQENRLIVVVTVRGASLPPVSRADRGAAPDPGIFFRHGRGLPMAAF
jgi:hypothetical protein